MFRLVTLFSLVIASTAAAATEARWGLTWRAPEGCIGPGDLAQAVEEKLGRAIFAKDPEYRVEGNLQQGTTPRWKARLTLVSAAGEVLGTRELTANDVDCRALDKKLALVMALTIEPQLERKAQPMMQAAEGGRPPMPKDASLVHIDTESRDVRLLRYAGTSYGSAYTGRGTATVTIHSFADECRAPCDTVINRSDDRFFIGGSGVTMTNEMILADHANEAGQVNLKVKAGSASGHFWGLMSFLTGVTAIGLGATFALIGGGSSYSGGGFVAGGIVTALVGGVLTAVGIPVWLNNRTEVSFPDGTVVR